MDGWFRGHKCRKARVDSGGYWPAKVVTVTGRDETIEAKMTIYTTREEATWNEARHVGRNRNEQTTYGQA